MDTKNKIDGQQILNYQNISAKQGVNVSNPNIAVMINGETKIHNSGREASKPSDISKKGWIAILKRLKDQIADDNVALLAAGVAFYFFLALFPAIAAAFSIYGLVVSPEQVQQQMSQMADFLPGQAHELVSNILRENATKSQGALGWGLLLSILFSLWSANKATTAVFAGINIAYHEHEDRGFIKKTAVTLMITLGVIIVGILSMVFVLGFPAFIDRFNLPGWLQTLLGVARWLVLAVIIFYSLNVVYKVAPDRKAARFKWLNWGSALATVVWLIGSILFTLYISNFGSYDKTYGSIAAVIILLLWFFLTGFIILLGAEINAQTEYQTTTDTTVGEEKPMGERGAHYADHYAGDGKRNK